MPVHERNTFRRAPLFYCPALRPNRRLLNALILAGLGLAGVLVLVGLAIAGLLWWSLPPATQRAAIPGLSGPVDIRLDQDGVPRIHAATALDGAAALGFVHARDRLFQMDLMRRNASGRLSEIAGPVTLRLDRTMRVLGLRRRAEADLATLPAETRALLDAYASGVNAWIDARGRFSAPEFILLGTPAPWTPVDSLLWGKTMGLWLSSNWRTKISRLSLIGKLAPRIVEELWPPITSDVKAHATIGPDPLVARAAERLAAVLPVFPGAFTLPSRASNEWAVDGAHSVTGAPLLAGDPHLAFGKPGIWYLARIETADGILAGATAPGVPFLVIGHNGHIAWTFTTTGADVQDVFIETPTADGGYLTPDGPRLFTLYEERIHIRGQPDDILQIRETRHGPVISDLDDGPQISRTDTDRPLLAVAMGNLAPNDTAAAGLRALNLASDIAEAGRASSLITSPAQNLLVADRERIALYVTGRIPVRRSPDGRFPVPGADGSRDWSGMASGAQLPRYIAPPDGRLVNANERIAPASFPVFLGSDWFGDWRARRIHDMLDTTAQHSVDSFVHMQMDVQSAYASQILPFVLAAGAPPGPAEAVLVLLRDWDGSMAMDRPQPLIFNQWLDQFYRLVLAKTAIPLSAGGPQAETVAFVLSPAGAHWCGGDCTDLLRQALVAAVADLTQVHGADPAAWRWGAAHQAVFAHPMLRAIPLLGWLTTSRIGVPGDDSTVNRQGGRSPSFDSVHGASYRGVYDLADLDRSRFVVAPGQSGHPLSRHAGDFISRWRDGATITLGPIPERVTATIRLTPSLSKP